MNVSMTVAPRRTSIRNAEDPYKKYWVAILAAFGLTGGWLCMPLMEPSVGATRVASGSSAMASDDPEQSLEGAVGIGAPGEALNLSMEGSGAYRRKAQDGPIASSLYQPPDGGAEAKDGETLGGAAGVKGAGGRSSASLAEALAAVGKKKDDGWGGRKAQRGFTSPKLSGGSLSGLGGGGGGSSASGAVGMQAFGSSNADVGFGTTRGLRDDGSGRAAGLVGSARALKAAQAASQEAVNTRSKDGSVNTLSKVFDGAGEQNSITAGGMGAAAAGYESLDMAPANLKANDLKLDSKEIKEAPPSAPPPMDDGQAQQQAMQIAGMVLSVMVGGMLPGAAGQAASMAIMMGTQMMAQQQAAARAEENARRSQERMKGKIGL